MSIEMCVLGSGSSGNATLLRVHDHAMLIDAGFGPRAILKRLEGTGVGLADIRAILLTHLDQDHFAPTWHNALLKHRIPLYCWRRHLHVLYNRPHETGGGADARLLHMHGLLEPIDDQPFNLRLDDRTSVRVRPIHLAHDRVGTLGYVLHTDDHRLGYATDLGRVPDHLIDAFTDVDYLAIESNYDPQMQLRSARPQMLKDRIMGGAGHLSNQESFDAVCRILDRSTRRPRHVVLLHLSRQCNDPALVRRVFHARDELREALCVTHQLQRTEWLRAGPTVRPLHGEQLTMFH